MSERLKIDSLFIASNFPPIDVNVFQVVNQWYKVIRLFYLKTTTFLIVPMLRLDVCSPDTYEEGTDLHWRQTRLLSGTVESLYFSRRYPLMQKKVSCVCWPFRSHIRVSPDRSDHTKGSDTCMTSAWPSTSNNPILGLFYSILPTQPHSVPCPVGYPPHSADVIKLLFLGGYDLPKYCSQADTTCQLNS